MSRLALLVALFFATPAFAQLEVEPIQKVNTPWKIGHPEGTQVKIVFGTVDGQKVAWRYLSEDHFVRLPSVTVVSAKVGEYLVVGADDIQMVKVIAGEGDEVPPNPNPGPNPKPEPPKPDPKPDPNKMKVNWAIWIEETMERNKFREQTNTMLDPELRSKLKEQDIKWFVYDKNHPQAKAYKVDSGKLPALVLWQEDPQKKVVLPAPKSVAEALEQVKSHSK